nr:MAG TPA: hypothetical protein [Caudoviricetes sp.]
MTPRKNTKNWTGLRRAALPLTTALILTLCGGCSPATRIVVLTPPDSLLADCPQPKTPEALMQSRDWRAYSLAATRLLVEYGEALDNCNADKAGLRVWRQAADEDLSHD